MKPSSPQPSSPRTRLGLPLVAAISVLWSVGVGAGLKFLLDYQDAPGAPAQPPAHWPQQSTLARASDRPTLLLMLHPRCPCTRATLGELARIVAHAGGRLALQIVFVVPHGKTDAWAETGLWRSALQVPGALVSLDRDGRESRLFGSYTSGQVLVYDEAGALRFAGGITPGRGHAGDNAGEAAVLALAHDRPGRAHTEVFGCALAAATAPSELRAHECAP